MDEEKTEVMKRLDDLGVHYNVAYKNKKLIDGLTLPLTPDQWWTIATRDGGAYVGGCCGNMSYVQDHIEAVFRDGGHLRAETFRLIATCMAEHDDVHGVGEVGEKKFTHEFIEANGLEETLRRMKEDGDDPRFDPWIKIAAVWQLVKDSLWQRNGIRRVHPTKQNPIDDAIRVLSNGMTSLSFHDFFKDPDEQKDEEKLSQESATRELLLHRLWDPLKTLYDRFHELRFGGPVDGFAVVDKETGNVASNGYGLCVYKTMRGVDGIKKIWNDGEEEPFEDHYEVKKVTVSVEDGLVFHDA